MTAPSIVGAKSDRHREQMRHLAEFCDVDEIRYVDHGNKEEYVLSKAGRDMTIFACGNKFDGGFLVVETMSDRGDTV